MKKNWFVRIFAALGGVLLCLLSLCVLAETFFQTPITAWAGAFFGARTPLAVLLALLLAIFVCTCGVCCLLMLTSRRAAKRTGFVMQKGENGAIGVSVRSIEGLVQTCVRQHDVVASAEISVVERRDGIIILLNIEEAAGVNIPLAVGALQKQIKQYVNACTGVDVHEVRVLVENTEETVNVSSYAVQPPVTVATAAAAAVVEAAMEETVYEAPVVEEVPAEPEVFPEAEPEMPEAGESPAETVETVPVVQPAPVVVPVIADFREEEDDRPLHQRLFGAEEEPVFVPAPPELVVEAPAEEIVLPAEEPAPAEALPEDPIAADAVLETVEAIVLEEAAAEQLALTGEEEAPAAEELPADEPKEE